jgi:small conductance mechanosensitive channel
VIVLVAVLGHLVVLGARRVSEWVLTPAKAPGSIARELLRRRHPKVASVTTLVVSALAFALYFIALGLVLNEFRVSLTAYLATASVVGLAVAFGLQGLVQDVVIGITFIFSDAFNVGDVVELSGQVGRVENIGLRFTTLVNLQGQRVYVPNRTIDTVARFLAGTVRAYVDVQLPDAQGATDNRVRQIVERIAKAMRAQHSAILLRDPEVSGPAEAGAGEWRYLRVKFRIWPGQIALLETICRPRLLTALREIDPAYQEWMITITQRV